MNDLIIRTAKKSDAGIILNFIRLLADYENLSSEVTATISELEQNLFGPEKTAEAIIGYIEEEPVAFAIYFHNFSTFLAQKGLYLEDLFVKPEYRNKGIGEKMLKFLAKLAIERNCGRFEWSVLDWNESAIQFYKNLGAEFKNEWIITRIAGEELKKLAE